MVGQDERDQNRPGLTGLSRISLDSQLFVDLNVEYVQKNRDELTSRVPDT